MKKKLIALILAGTLTAACFYTASADEISDLQEEAEYNEQILSDINASIDELEYRKGELLGQIDVADQQLVLTLATISTLNTQIDLKSQQLSETTKSLYNAEEEEANEYDAMKRRIQYIYETGGDAGWATLLLNDLDITDLLNRAEYTEKIYEYDRDCLDHYAAVVQYVSDLKAQYEREKSDLEFMRANHEEQQQSLEAMLAEMRMTSDNYDEQLAGASEAAAAYVELINEQNYMIQELLAEQERQRAAAAAAAAAAEAAAAEAAAAEQAAAEAAAAEAEAAAEEARRMAEESSDEEVQRAAEEARQAAEEARQAAEEAAREAEEEARRAEEEANQQQEEGGQEGSEDVPYYAETGNAIVDRAYAWIGRAEYVWGGCSPGAFDCSGFVSYCVTGQYTRIGTTYTFLTYTQVSDPQPGDICTNETHCGIYVGDGMMIHASTYGVGVIKSAVNPSMIFVRP